MIFQRDCPAQSCNYKTDETRMLIEMDSAFQTHMQTAHLDDGEYEMYLVNELCVDPEAAMQTIFDLRAQKENPPSEEAVLG